MGVSKSVLPIVQGQTITGTMLVFGALNGLAVLPGLCRLCLRPPRPRLREIYLTSGI